MSNPQFQILLRFICVLFYFAGGGASPAGCGLDFRALDEVLEPPQVLLDLPLIEMCDGPDGPVSIGGNVPDSIMVRARNPGIGLVAFVTFDA